jgi:TPR repeat protein
MVSRIWALVVASLLVFPAAAQADFGQGKVAYDSGNWKEAITNLRPEVESGDARAMVLLANMYGNGHGVDQNFEEAFTLYRRAAALHNLEGILATATLYQEGKGIGKNTRLAILWFERGAKLGDQAAAFFYAVHLYQGSKGDTYDFKPDHPAAYKWFKIAENGKGFPAMGITAGKLAEEIGKKLNALEIASADRQVAAWQPQKPEELGPAPDLVPADSTAVTPEKAPEETPEATPEVAPEAVPEKAAE